MADLPPGFALDGPKPAPGAIGGPNLLKPLFDVGAVATNGYRTPADIQRLKAQGYTPAANSDHLRGDAVDLVPGKSGLTLAQLSA